MARRRRAYRSPITIGIGLKNAIELGLPEILWKDPMAALSPEEVVARLPVAPSNPDAHCILGKVLYPVAVHATYGDGTSAERKARRRLERRARASADWDVLLVRRCQRTMNISAVEDAVQDDAFEKSSAVVQADLRT
jgi:hypothetical protein